MGGNVEVVGNDDLVPRVFSWWVLRTHAEG